MQVADIFENNLRVKANPYSLYVGTVYEPEFMPIREIQKATNIHFTTLYWWRRKGLVESNRNGEVKIQSLVNYILYKSKKKSFGKSCTRWTEEEKKTLNTERSANAKRIMKHRIKKVKNGKK